MLFLRVSLERYPYQRLINNTTRLNNEVRQIPNIPRQNNLHVKKRWTHNYILRAYYLSPELIIYNNVKQLHILSLHTRLNASPWSLRRRCKGPIYKEPFSIDNGERGSHARGVSHTQD